MIRILQCLPGPGLTRNRAAVRYRLPVPFSSWHAGPVHFPAWTGLSLHVKGILSGCYLDTGSLGLRSRSVSGDAFLRPVPGYLGEDPGSPS
ncbi:MAG: hypothetical protein KGI54_09010 [Pseudomonadota bacterium]|nr:hypothetical protein [Pseudomonadota bacterium]